MEKTNTPEELKRLEEEQKNLAKKYYNLVTTDTMAALSLRPQVFELANKIEILKNKLNGSPPPGPVVAVAETPVAPVETQKFTNARQAFANEERKKQEENYRKQQEYIEQQKRLQQEEREKKGEAQLLQQKRALEEEMDRYNKARLGPPTGGTTIGFANAALLAKNLARKYGGGKRKNKKTKHRRTRQKRTRRYKKN